MHLSRRLLGSSLWRGPVRRPTLQKINAVTNRYLQSARGQELIAKQAVEMGGGTPADAAAFVKLELGKWEPVIKAANISLD
jgi:tripartite-type tricarboxylate transporter receptor subunit TctC